MCLSLEKGCDSPENDLSCLAMGKKPAQERLGMRLYACRVHIWQVHVILRPVTLQPSTSSQAGSGLPVGPAGYRTPSGRAREVLQEMRKRHNTIGPSKADPYACLKGIKLC